MASLRGGVCSWRRGRPLPVGPSASPGLLSFHWRCSGGSAVAHLVAAPHAPSYLTPAHCPHPPPLLATFLSRVRPFRSSLVPLPTLSCYCSQILFLIFSFHFIALLLARANSFLKLLLLPRSVLFSRTSWDDGYTLFCRVQFNSHMWLMLPKSWMFSSI